MKTKNRTIEVPNFFNSKADVLINKRINQIKNDVKSFATDMARQSRPLENDSSLLFIPKIKGLFEALLENLLRMIGAFAVLHEDGSQIEKHYKEEEEQLESSRSGLLEDQRLLQKQIEGLKDVSALIRRWIYKWRPVLISLSIGETAINYKILLLVTPNVLTAIIASLGLCVSLFIVSHSFKDILAYFQSRTAKMSVGTGIVLGITLLLYSFNKLRISFMEAESSQNADISEWQFVTLNLVMWLSGTIIAVIYKPLKTTIAKHNEFKKVNVKLQEINKELKRIANRFEQIPFERNQKLLDLKNLRFMAKHYENTIVSEYYSAVALFTSENLFMRKDGVSPKAFLEEPPKLKTYFDDVNDKNELL